MTENLKNLVVFSRGLKKLAYRVLTNQKITQSRIYDFFYKRKVEKAMSRYSNLPHRLRIENTNICNADCVFCPHSKMKRKQGIMDLDLFKEIIEQVKFYGISLVSIHGFGEPLLDKHFFQRVRYAKARNVKKIATNTNASFLNDTNIKELLISGLDEVYISFDAATKAAYNRIRPGLDFDQVESNIRKIVQAKKAKKLKSPKIILSFVECPENQSEVGLYLKKWRSLVDEISISYLVNWGGKFSGSNLLKDSPRRDPCRFLWTDMAISWDGKVSICCYDYENEVILGDLTKDDLKKVWKSETLKNFRRLHLESKFNQIAICKNCVANLHSKNPWWVVK